MGAKEQSIQLPFSKFKGLVLKPSIVDREFNSAQLCSNVEKTINGQGTVRKPVRCMYYQPTTYDHQALFPFTYTYHDVDTGTTVEELLAIGMAMNASFVDQGVSLYKITENTLNISYSGAGNGVITFVPVLVSSFDGTYQWQTTVTANGVTQIFRTDVSAGSKTVGTLGTFVTALHANANFNCSPTSLATAAASSFVDVLPQSITIASGSSENFTYYSYELIGTGDTAPWVFTDAAFILPSAVNYSNVIYFAYGSYEYKYDGQDFYRSGLPQGLLTSVADSAGGTTHTLGNVYIYKIVYARKDVKGNIIEGEDSDDTLAAATHTMAATRDIDLTVNNLRNNTDYSKFALKSSKVNGAQVGVTTITVDAGGWLEVGDIAYFYDGVSAAYVEREITAVAATTITIAGAAVNVADNIFISNNVRIQIWRTKNAGTDFYFVDEIPNDVDLDTQVYTDDTPDSSLTELFVDQLRKHSLPPKCSFIGTHQGLKLSAGDPDNPNRMMWALPNDIEAYPIESNLTDIKAGGLGALTGFGSANDDTIIAFKEFGYAHVKGTLDDLNFEVKDRANTGIGCTSFRSLAYVGEKDSLIGVSRRGVFIFRDEDVSLDIGDPIRPLFKQPQTTQVNGTAIPITNWTDYFSSTLNLDVERVLKRAVAINDSLRSKYHLYLPAEVGVPENQKVPLYLSSKYLVFHYETEIPYWTEYSFQVRYRSYDSADLYNSRNVTPVGGFTVYKNAIWMGAYNRGNANKTDATLHRIDEDAESDEYIEAAYPVYLDLHYNPITRDENAPSGLFKPLFINVYKFLKDILADIQSDVGLGSNFSLRVRGVKDFKNYPTPAYTPNALRTFYVEDGNTAMSVKCPTDKCRAFQIQLTTEDAAITYEAPVIDNVEFIYSVPYDKKYKDPKATSG